MAIETTDEHTEATFRLQIPRFDVKTLNEVRTIIMIDMNAPKVANKKVLGFIEPGMKLVGIDGDMSSDVAQRLNTKCTAYLHELIDQPTLADTWALSGSETFRLGSLSMASHSIAHIVYSEFGRMVGAKHKAFLPILDAILVVGLTALTMGADPAAAYQTVFSVESKDAETGVTVITPKDQVTATCQMAANLFFSYMHFKNLLTDDFKLEPKGARLLQHLQSVIGATESLRSEGVQGLVIEALEAERNETKTGSEILEDAKKGE